MPQEEPWFSTEQEGGRRRNTHIHTHTQNRSQLLSGEGKNWNTNQTCKFLGVVEGMASVEETNMHIMEGPGGEEREKERIKKIIQRNNH